MFYKKVLVGGILGLSMSVVAAATAASFPSANESGMYFSLGGGTDLYTQSIDELTNYDLVAIPPWGGATHYPVSVLSQGAIDQRSSLFGRATAGYGFAVGANYYLALELSYDYLNGDKQDSSKNLKSHIQSTREYPTDQVQQKGSFSVKAQNQLGFNLLFGRTVFNNILAYAKVGYTALWANIDANIDAHVSFQGNDESFNVNHTFNKVMTAPIFGLGLRLPISRHFKLAAEYDYVNFGTEHFSGKARHNFNISNLSYADVDYSGAVKRTSSNYVSTSLVYLF